MSKIEDALNKSRRSRESNTKGLSVINNASEKDLVLGGGQTALTSTGIQHESTAKEISLMESGDILDCNELEELRIIHSEMADNKIANTFRELRTKLIQQSKGKNFIAMVTSCAEDCDSGLTSLNISIAFTFDESKTSLLLDCNLKNPKLDTLLNMETDKGLTDYMQNESIQVDTIMHKTGVKRLKMIPAGTYRESATEYFTSLRMRNLMGDLLSRYSDRYIFLDTAPITESADTRILVDLCDFVILDVPYGTSSLNKINEAVKAIGEEKLLGIVFTNVPKPPKLSLF
ncbi:MAG: hypothetical protein QM500_14685 [Methylococcales bacterium]